MKDIILTSQEAAFISDTLIIFAHSWGDREGLKEEADFTSTPVASGKLQNSPTLSLERPQYDGSDACLPGRLG